MKKSEKKRGLKHQKKWRKKLNEIKKGLRKQKKKKWMKIILNIINIFSSEHTYNTLSSSSDGPAVYYVRRWYYLLGYARVWVVCICTEQEPLCLICIFHQRSIFFSQFNFFSLSILCFVRLCYEAENVGRIEGRRAQWRGMWRIFFLKWNRLYWETLGLGMA